MKEERIVWKETGNYRKPYESEEDYFLSGVQIERKYPEYTAFLQPDCIGVIINLTTNKVVRKFYNNPFPVPIIL